ncbi:dicer-2 [Leptinotarsa decemlineata]|uniref:dicer-2 n=1 Tax=Leptinotarsa decemlineata TaxID=7539 RepID=UPI000C25353E|nr:endoribonuclease Dicer-like [Leptinotarsa decemlineata]
MSDFTPRNYQVELMKIGIDKNTIIFLPTGSGKTFIALMILKQMSQSLLKPYSEGGKISIILVNTVALVDQHAGYILQHTHFSVGRYTGEMNVDAWRKDRWNDEFDNNQVLIMTSQILVNLNNQNFIDLNRVNLLIFDECHRGVNDHSMRQLMKSFGTLVEPPRVLGLTAPLLNGNCKPDKVMDGVLALETTYHSKVATVDGLADVVGYSTNPTEEFKFCQGHTLRYPEYVAVDTLKRTIAVLKVIRIECFQNNILGLKPLDPGDTYKRLWNLLEDVIVHIQIMGTYGGVKAAVSHLIQIERLKQHCDDDKFMDILNTVQTSLSFIKQFLEDSMKGHDEKSRIYNFSSHKILTLLEILREFRTKSQEELCAIIFTERRFAAKVIFFILDALSKCDPEFKHMKTNFIVGFNNNPYNDTRESMFQSKKNKEVLNSFTNKEINVLVASDVLEEGVDIPRCTLVVKYDKPKDYRSYIQSKGRARHKASIYYMIVEEEEITKYSAKYKDFQLVEETLNNYLIGKNTERQEPDKDEIEKMYQEDELPPYYVNGPGSAQVNMLSAIPLLCQYCSCLPSDIYTEYAPDWYIKTSSDHTETKMYSVVIMLPTICPIVDVIEGPSLRSAKNAKRAAALKACILLHKAGELDDHLQPRKQVVKDEDVGFLFKHYPAIKETNAGVTKTRRLHKKQISKFAQGQIKPYNEHFLHVIELEPNFQVNTEDINYKTIYDVYTSPLCYGIITPNPLPTLCSFPIYVTMGTINVTLKVNAYTVTLTQEEIDVIKKFHFQVYDDILKIVQSFLIFDNSVNAEMLLLVAVDKIKGGIDFDAMTLHGEVKLDNELTTTEKQELEVNQETYLRKIICPWYRADSPVYIVTEVCLNRDAYYDFPNETYGSFKEYFEEKHKIRIVNPTLPLLYVKGLTKRINFIKPVGKEAKKKRERSYEEMTEYLLPELVVKQDFPSALWIQANLLPTIVSRISYMLQIEELRCKIAQEAGLGRKLVPTKKPLELDNYVLDYVPFMEEEQKDDVLIEANQLFMNIPTLQINTDFTKKMLEAQYPWKDEEEPKDLERDITATVMDVAYYETFINKGRGSSPVKMNGVSSSPIREQQLALTFQQDYLEKSLEILDRPSTIDGPELRDLYRALTTAKANDIVNLERLETLGDSFLKYLSSVYILMRFPQYNEGRATSLKGKMVSNESLFYLAIKKNLGGIMKYNELSPRNNWLPPAFTIPREMARRIEDKELSVHSLFGLSIKYEEQIAGEVDEETLEYILQEDNPPEDNEENSYHTMSSYLKCQYIGDKQVADVVESLLGAFLQSNGLSGGIKFIEWMGIIPHSENVQNLLNRPSPDPVLNVKGSKKKIEYHLPQAEVIEKILGYKFQNRAFLLQALTHPSYTPNRLTLSYEKLEFIGDAVLDFLITCHIYESCGNLDPGELTDLRSALVNNNTFASLVVRHGLHKFLLMINSKLQVLVDKFANMMERKNHVIDDEVMILLEEGENNLAESVDVPKILGDIFEALAGAIYLDSNKNLKTVWRVFYKIMWKEINLFSANVPKNVVRRLFEWTGAHPKFGQLVPVNKKKCVVPLCFMLNGTPKYVHGFGSNKQMAKKAAAKLALRLLAISK